MYNYKEYIPIKVADAYDASGTPIYKYRIKILDIQIDNPMVRVPSGELNNDNENEESGVLSQAAVLLSLAANGRLDGTVSMMNKLAIKTFKTKHPDKGNAISKELKDLDKLLKFVYDFTTKGLTAKSKNYNVFADDTSNLAKTHPLKKMKANKKENLTEQIIIDKKKEIETFIRKACGAVNDQAPISDVEKYNLLTKYISNVITVYDIRSHPLDKIAKPSSKLQMFGNPLAETNIVLTKGTTNGAEVTTNAKYLYSMQVYMVQNNVYLLDYSKLTRIFVERPNDFPGWERTGITGIDKRWSMWMDYFNESLTDTLKPKLGMYTEPFEIYPDISLTPTYSYNTELHKDLTTYYDILNNKITPVKYKFRNKQKNEDSPIISHINYIMALRGFSIDIQGYTDFDEAERYIAPSSYHPRVIEKARNPSAIKVLGDSIMCREYAIFNCPNNLLYLGYSSTLPDYSAYNAVLFEKYFNDGILTFDNDLIKGIIKDTNDAFEANNNNFFVNFSDPRMFSTEKIYGKNDINIFTNKYKMKKNKGDLKIIPKAYTNPESPNDKQKGIPQLVGLQHLLNDYHVRFNIYNTILSRLYKITKDNRWRLTMVNSDILNTQQNQTFSGLKVVFTTATLEEMCLKDDSWILENINKFKNLDDVDYSNFISNINSGKIVYNNNMAPAKITEVNPFTGDKYNLIDAETQTKLLIKSPLGITNPDLNVIYDLIKFNKSCPNDWNLKDPLPVNMSAPEAAKCIEIAKKISDLNDPLLTKLLQNQQTVDCKDAACLTRISELRLLGNSANDVNEYDDDDL